MCNEYAREIEMGRVIRLMEETKDIPRFGYESQQIPNDFDLKASSAFAKRALSPAWRTKQVGMSMSRRESKPQRLRLSRRAGFKLQKHSAEANGLPAIVVSRPSRWGNPYRIETHGRERAVALYEASLRRRFGNCVYEEMEPLRGNNLACWCPLDLACHADVLLRLANGTAGLCGEQ
jgi:hypothetical protein